MTSLHSSSWAAFSIMDYMSMDYYPLHDLDRFSASTTTSTTPIDDDDYWNQWCPLLNCDAFTGPHHEFHSLIDGSIITQEPYTEDEGEFKGVRLVHLLMAAAEALSGGSKGHELARVILIRLNHLVTPTHPSLTNMERLASYFTHALHALLLRPPPTNNNNNHMDTDMDMVAAFQLLQDMSPSLKFAHFTSNQAILEALAADRRLHVIDFDIMEGIQWASLIQALSSTPNGPHLRITALSRTSPAGGGRRSISSVQETGRRLTEFAASLGQPFSFHQCRLDPDQTFRPSALKLVRGEALVFNCMLHLPHLTHRPPESVASFLNGAKELSPRLVTMVEEEGAWPGPGEGGFAGRFMECLHHYSALYDSLEAGIPMESGARALVERVYLGPRIARSVARIYNEGAEEERPGSWGEWLGEMGYRGVGMSFSNQCQANLLLGLFNDGFKAEVLGSNRLVLSWRSRSLLSASLWTSP